MRVVREQDVARFAERVAPHLRERPAENNLMLGLLGDLARAGGISSSETGGQKSAPQVPAPVLLSVQGPRGIEAVALQTPPRALIVSRAGDEAIDALIAFVLPEDIRVGGVSGPDATAERFASRWAARTERAALLRMTQTVYELARVRPTAPTPGELRAASAGDEALLAAWSEAFHREAALDPLSDHLGFVRGKMAAQQLFVWDNGAPVAMAAWGGRTGQGVRVSYVYTPVAERKKGYASAAVAALSQRLLDEGSPRCFLFANAGNATANKIYQALGYDPVCDFRLYDFS